MENLDTVTPIINVSASPSLAWAHCGRGRGGMARPQRQSKEKKGNYSL